MIKLSGVTLDGDKRWVGEWCEIIDSEVVTTTQTINENL